MTPEPSTTIRLALPTEYDAVGELTASAYQSDGFIPAGSDYGLTLRAAADRAAKAEVWVAASATELLGTVTFCPVGSVYREIGRDDEGEFRMLGVSPAARGRGVGTALTEHCIERSRELGFARVVMSSARPMTTAHRIYERLGFTRLPERDWSPRPGVDLYAFTLDL
ncbi:acetyltransferase (GNAT) family protein [Kribbella voronezhensis]|uniref:Acetyltransferase (GNAT) family protein n=1 Tax=Kribbella voronezhensis TaxID=2512212 RepID=A0A4R7SUI0_9ACTN|nr:GNAT family N-acetyltransferase [Kribbella voronezhensis]TDU82429.1 acetyltransferase (GNAT) family protein [Kribbella voronezhensis]